MEKSFWILISLFMLSLAGCGNNSNEQTMTMKARPVSVMELQERDFAQEIRLTGSVTLYREEQVGFEVGGRVLSVIDIGTEVLGPAFNEKGELVRRGNVIATLENTRFQRAVGALQARRSAAKRDLEGRQAELRLAQQTLQRQKKILTEGAGVQQAVDDAQARYDSMLARSAQSQAVIRQVEEEFLGSQEDFADSNLFAPFSGRITRQHVTQGAVVDAGTPVVTLSLMDPIQVQVEVSADEDRRIQTGARAVLYPKDPVNPDADPIAVNALVYEKDSIADPDTRTFRIDLMVRNSRRRIEQFLPETQGLPIVNDFLPVVRQYEGERGPLFVRTDSIYSEDGETYVLRLPGVSFSDKATRGALGKHMPEKVKVELSDDYFTVIKWNFRSIKDGSLLSEGDFLVNGPRAEHLTGIAIGRPQWLLRPGDLVPTQFLLHATEKGFYVPVNIIDKVNDKHVVFVIEDNIARLKEVMVFDSYQELRRIEGDGIQVGTVVVVEGVHYLSDGQPVNIIKRDTYVQ